MGKRDFIQFRGVLPLFLSLNLFVAEGCLIPRYFKSKLNEN